MSTTKKPPKTTDKKLKLKTQKLRELTPPDLDQATGGMNQSPGSTRYCER